MREFYVQCAFEHYRMAQAQHLVHNEKNYHRELRNVLGYLMLIYYIDEGLDVPETMTISDAIRLAQEPLPDIMAWLLYNDPEDRFFEHYICEILHITHDPAEEKRIYLSYFNGDIKSFGLTKFNTEEGMSDEYLANV